jgi:hypothetical protein
MDARVAYLAGIIDGEGTVYAQKIRGRFNVRIYVVSTDVRLVRWLEQNFGGLVYHRNSPTHATWKTKWEWVVDKRETTRILELVLPYLIVKREQAELGIALRRDIEAKRGRDVDHAYRQMLGEKIRSLNHVDWSATETKSGNSQPVAEGCDSPVCTDDKRAEAGGNVQPLRRVV